MNFIWNRIIIWKFNVSFSFIIHFAYPFYNIYNMTIYFLSVRLAYFCHFAILQCYCYMTQFADHRNVLSLSAVKSVFWRYMRRVRASCACQPGMVIPSNIQKSVLFLMHVNTSICMYRFLWQVSLFIWSVYCSNNFVTDTHMTGPSVIIAVYIYIYMTSATIVMRETLKPIAICLLENFLVQNFILLLYFFVDFHYCDHWAFTFKENWKN